MSTYNGFKNVELRRPERSYFDLSHEKRISTRFGKLTPVFISETMPNDTFNVQTEVLVKLAPMLAPIYHRVNCFVHYFFVPNRLLWDEWEPFITNGRLGTETPPVPPGVLIEDLLGESLEYLNVGELYDYLGGAPIADSETGSWTGRVLDLMPFGAYYKVWYDYYRDRNYTSDNSVENPTRPVLPFTSYDAGFDDFSVVAMRYRCWQHDYFTSALPWTQRGAEVLMPLEGSGSVTDYLANSQIYTDASTQTGTPLASTSVDSDASVPRKLKMSGSTGIGVVNIQNDGITVDASSVSINDLRQAIRLQEWLERNALAGSRYNESIMAHFGRKTSDGRLQRAQYLGGGKAVVQVGEVMTTAWSQDDLANDIPPANRSGSAGAYSTSNSFTYNCEEHGFVIGILSIMPTTAYMQGTHRMFLQRNTFLEYPWPSFAHLGEQEVYDYEIYADGTSMPADRTSAPVMGYQSRYSDWKFIHNSSHGDFRTSLDYWHLSRLFASQPVLGETFVTFEDALQDRIFSVAESDTVWLYVYNKVGAKRSLPYYGTPQL